MALKYMFEKQDLIDRANRRFNNSDINIMDISMCDRDDIDYNFITVMLPYSEQEYELSFDGESFDEMLSNILSVINQQLDDMINYLNDCKVVIEE